MLTDIFAVRYANRRLWTEHTETHRALLVQCFRILAEQVIPYWSAEKKIIESEKKIWVDVERQLSMELGLEELSPHVYGFHNAQKHWISGAWQMDQVCKTWMLTKFEAGTDPNRFMQERLSLVELAFRLKAQSLWARKLGEELYKKQYGGLSAQLLKGVGAEDKVFAQSVEELNVRMGAARVPLNYHNGYLQIVTDELVQREVAEPFWRLVAAPKWENVSTDMAEAVDRRDTGGRDPAWYAARALESVVKIICKEKQWATGNERGAGNFIDHLVSKANGRFIDVWEMEQLTHFFREVRNPLGHGPGDGPMPSLTQEQTNWAIENAMSWCKSLIQRLETPAPAAATT